MENPEPSVFRLTLSGLGVAIDKEVNQAVAIEVMRVALGGAATANSSQAETRTREGSRQADTANPRLSLREFIDSTGARSNPEKIAAFAFYLRDHAGQDDFSRDEVKACFRQAGETLPGNFPRDFQNAFQNGWIAEDHGKPGRFYVTRKGEELIKRKSGDL